MQAHKLQDLQKRVNTVNLSKGNKRGGNNNDESLKQLYIMAGSHFEYLL